MLNRKTLNIILSALMIVSLTLGQSVHVSAQAQPSAQAGNNAMAMPMSAVDESKVPHYFGPYSNYANSPQVLADAIVTISPAPAKPGAVGNPLVDRGNATDYATAPGTLGNVFVVMPNAVLPNGTLSNFQSWNQATAGSSPTPSAGGLFHAYVLRPTGTASQYQVVYDSGELAVPALSNPSVSEVATYAVSPAFAVQAGDVLGFYGQGIPVDVGGGSDILSYPATADTTLATTLAPAQGDTITVGTDPGYPFYSQDRIYSFAATVTPSVVDPGTGAEAAAVVDPKTGGISAVNVTSPGSGYLTAPNVTITSAGVTPTALASATAQISVGVISSISVAESGFGFTTPVVTLSGGNPTPGNEATAVASGFVDNVTIADGGSGYTIQPLVEFSLPQLPGGIQATGLATMDANGAVIAVDVTNPGSGYTSAPTVNIWDGAIGQLPNGSQTTPGVSATVAATIGINQIDVTSGGQGYDSAPTVSILDGGTADLGASAVATVSVRGAVTSITVTAPGAGYLTPGIKKFVDTLPGLGPTAANDLGQYIPVAVPDTTTYPGTDYYEIAVVQYSMKFHRDLPPTLLRGYVQLSTSVVPGAQKPLTNELLNGSKVPALLPDGTQALGVDNPHYLGPAIVATKDKPVRILFRNLLPTGVDGNLFLPVDTTVMGAGAGPNMMTLDANGVPMEMAPDLGSVTDGVRNPMCGMPGQKMPDCYSENRATLHLHGGITPWISDGTPHQWTTPAGENTDYPQGVSVSNVPDMPDPGPGAITFFYTNQQSARLMFYHDHAWGITRLNVYAGEAAAYVLTDPMEQQLLGTGGALEGLGIGTPLIIQDKTFVSKNIAAQDPTWDASRWGGEGSLWAPHVYMPAQNPNDPSGMSSFGRWMYGPWFWPPAKDAKYQPIANPYYNMDPNGPDGIRGTADDWSTPLAVPCDLNDPTTWQYQSDPFCEPPLIPSTTNLSVGMEAFNDTPIVNGTAYPTTNVDPKAYRFRILNAANDRFWNLQWYVADPTTGTLSEVALKASEVAAAQTDPNVFPTPDTTKSPAGPSWIQIGTEGGFLPTPVVIPNQPITWITDPTRFDVGNVDQHSLLLAPAERADVIVDFSQYRGKTLILYNDAPAAFPARVACYDYYTGDPDLSPACAPSTLPGYGPNTRTIMQVKVSTAAPAVAFDRPNTTADRMGTLMAAFAHHLDANGNPAGVFEAGSDPIIVGQAAYNSAYGTNFVASGWCNSPSNPSAKCDGYARIAEGSQPTDKFGFNTLAAPNSKMQIPFEPKAIHDEMNSANFDEWGRMTANLGLEAPGATPLTQNIILYPYVNPATELLDSTALPSSLHVAPISSAADGTQIWKITHNGVDTHPIHWHLFDVQVLNRVTWDNIVMPPDPNELGWKDTVRISPLEDTIVAVRPIVPVLPFAIPDSKRPLNPMMPIGARGSQNGPNGIEAGFNNTDAAGNPIPPIINQVVDFGWEYVFHCHILSHEEMDMMRPVSVHVANGLPDAPVLTFTRGSVILNWTDGTPVDYRNPATWGSPKNEIGFKIERALLDINGNPGAFQVIATALANVTTYTDLTADPAYNYDYRVTAFNKAGNSQSNILLVTALPPADPTNLAATAVDQTHVSLTWTDNATNELGYTVERALVTNGVPGTFSAIDGLGVNANSYTDATASPNTTYAYRVYAYNRGGNSGYSNVAQVTTPDLPPAAPSVLTANLQAGPQIALAWTDNASNETSFVVERSVNGGAFVAFPALPANTVSYIDTAVTAGNTYDYRVMATNAAGPSAYSNTASVNVPALGPAAPSNLAASVLAFPTRVRLTFTDNATNETGFVVERSANGGAFTVLANLPALAGTGGVTYTDSTAVSGNTYAYRVKAVNAGGSSAYSNTVNVTIGSGPAAPSNLTATLLGNPLRIRLTFRDNATNEANFIVERSDNGGAFNQIATVAARTGTGNVTYTDASVVVGNNYSYRVKAVNALGSSAYSNTSAVINIAVPAAPSNAAVTVVRNGTTDRVTLTWTDNATNETSFRIQRSTSAAFTTVNTYNVAANSVTFQQSTARNRTYYYRIQAVNNITGASAWVVFLPSPIVTP